MKNREFIRQALISRMTEELRQACYADGLTDENNIKTIIVQCISGFEIKADNYLDEYDSHLFDSITDRIANRTETSSVDFKNFITTAFNDIKGSFQFGHESIKGEIENLSLYAKKVRMCILKDEIAEIKQEKTLLTNHAKALNRIAEIEAGKSSWLFVFISLIAITIWSALIYVKGFGDMEQWTFIFALVLSFCNFFYYALYGKYFTPESQKNIKMQRAKDHIFSLYKFDEKYILELDELLERKQEELKRVSKEFDERISKV